MFQPKPEKPLVETPDAIKVFTRETIVECWQLLRELADKHNGIDYPRRSERSRTVLYLCTNR